MSTPHDAPPGRDGPPAAANFLQFLSGLAVQTLVHLGKVAYPMTGQRRVDLPNARYSIDLIAVLQEKTRGNLDPGESRYLADVLHDLRVEYVKVAEAAPPAPGEGAEGGPGDPTGEAGEARP